MAPGVLNIGQLANSLINQAKTQGLEPAELRIGADMEPALEAWMESLFLVNDPALPSGKRSLCGLPLVSMRANGLALATQRPF